MWNYTVWDFVVAIFFFSSLEDEEAQTPTLREFANRNERKRRKREKKKQTRKRNHKKR